MVLILCPHPSLSQALRLVAGVVGDQLDRAILREQLRDSTRQERGLSHNLRLLCSTHTNAGRRPHPQSLLYQQQQHLAPASSSRHESLLSVLDQIAANAQVSFVCVYVCVCVNFPFFFRA